MGGALTSPMLIAGARSFGGLRQPQDDRAAASDLSSVLQLRDGGAGIASIAELIVGPRQIADVSKPSGHDYVTTQFSPVPF